LSRAFTARPQLVGGAPVGPLPTVASAGVLFTDPCRGRPNCKTEGVAQRVHASCICMAHTLVRRLARVCRDTSGATIIEAAVILPLIALLTFSVMDFAVVFYVYLSLENGVSAATRFAVTGNNADDPSHPGTPLGRAASIELAMRQATPTLTLPDTAFTFSHMAPGGAAWIAGVGGPNDIERVGVNYTWNIMTPLMRPFFPGGQVALHVESAMKNEGRFN
jgi:Flp pilus assembly protein TadG